MENAVLKHLNVIKKEVDMMNNTVTPEEHKVPDHNLIEENKKINNLLMDTSVQKDIPIERVENFKSKVALAHKASVII